MRMATVPGWDMEAAHQAGLVLALRVATLRQGGRCQERKHGQERHDQSHCGQDAV